MQDIKIVKLWSELNNIINDKTNLKIDVTDDEFIIYDKTHIYLKTNSINNLHGFILGYTLNFNKKNK